MTRDQLRLCLAVRLLRLATKQPDGARTVTREQRAAWAADAAELDKRIGPMLCQAFAGAGPSALEAGRAERDGGLAPAPADMECDDVIAVVDRLLVRWEQG